jgi:hypothetical protein
VKEVEYPATVDLSIGWVVKAGRVSLTRSEAGLLVAVPVGLVTRQRNWSWSMVVVVVTLREAVVVPLYPEPSAIIFQVLVRAACRNH